MKKKRVLVGDFKINKDEKKAIMEVIKGGRISEWKKVREFERLFAEYIGTKYCIAVSSGTAALLVGLMALLYDNRFPKAKKGAKIITSPVTYASTINAILLAGFEPVFVDIDLHTFKLKIDQIEELLKNSNSSEYAGILPVHLMGYINDMDAINSLATQYDLFVFEDSAQAHGSLYKEKKAGGLGLLADFSFYIAHNIQAGEMGCITTNDEKIFKLIKQLKANGRVCNCRICTRNQGICPYISKDVSGEDLDPRFTHEYVAYNFKTTEFAPALGISQVKKADAIFRKRQNNVKYLNELLKPYEEYFYLPVFDENVSYLAYPIIVKEKKRGITRKIIREELEQHGVENRPLFGCMPTQQPAFAKYKKKYNNKLPNANYIGKNAFYIGCHQYLKKRNLDFIAEMFEDIIHMHRYQEINVPLSITSIPAFETK